MRGADICCGSAGIYNVVQNEMAMRILASKMKSVNATDAGVVATANPGCMLQLEAGVRMHGKEQKVMHVVELLDEAYRGKGMTVSWAPRMLPAVVASQTSSVPAI
jgi:glycolate oxidase iron-sulfur subunit